MTETRLGGLEVDAVAGAGGSHTPTVSFGQLRQFWRWLPIPATSLRLPPFA